jgi:alkyl hydroperoxide reductase subunit AhpC
MLEKVKFPMGSDRTGTLSRLFEVYDAATGNALRGTFIINPEGVLLNAEVNFYNLGRNVDEMLRKLKANIHLASNPAEACPAQWKQEGDKTLKPSAKVVGKVFEALK